MTKKYLRTILTENNPKITSKQIFEALGVNLLSNLALEEKSLVTPVLCY